MNRLRQIYGITCMNLIPFIRNPLWSVAVLVTPISMLIIFYIYGGANMGVHALIGGLVAFSMNGGIVSLPQYTVRDKAIKFNYLYVSSPISPAIYHVGAAIGTSFPLIPPTILMLIITELVVKTSLYGFIALLGVIGLTWIVGCLIGFYISAAFKDMMYISAVANTLGMVLYMLPPVYYPVTALSPFYKPFLLLIPSCASAHLMRGATGILDVPINDMIFSILVLASYIIIFGLVTVKKIVWVEK